MDATGWLLGRFRDSANRPALVWRDQEVSYGELTNRVDRWLAELPAAGVGPGATVALVGDYSPAAVSCLLALMRLGTIVVPLAWGSIDQHGEFCQIAMVEHLIEIDRQEQQRVRLVAARSSHPLLDQLRAAGQAGLVLFSSGSTGQAKAVLHSLPNLLEKFRPPRRRCRTVSMLLFDHIGGFNTLLYTLANLGCLIIPAERSPAGVCEAIQQHRAELLPTSPSFLNMLLLAEAHRGYDLSSLTLVTYGSELMPERTLRLANAALPRAEFQQTYGLSELGILRSKSSANDSLLLKVGGEGYETKVMDGTLRIRSACSMLGYLNALSPFDQDGWFNTGDAVIQEGDWYRILGRQSHVINVGGQKVYPAEVERVIAELPGVIDVTVSGERHLLLGQVVVATVQVAEPVPAFELRKRIAAHGKGRLQPYMLPVKVRLATEPAVISRRLKKVRS